MYAADAESGEHHGLREAGGAGAQLTVHRARHCFSFDDERPVVESRRSACGDDAVLHKIVEVFRFAVFLEISGAGVEPSTVTADLFRDDLIGLRAASANGDVDTVAAHVSERIIHQKINDQSGMTCHQFGQARHDDMLRHIRTHSHAHDAAHIARARKIRDRGHRAFA